MIFFYHQLLSNLLCLGQKGPLEESTDLVIRSSICLCAETFSTSQQRLKWIQRNLILNYKIIWCSCWFCTQATEIRSIYADDSNGSSGLWLGKIIPRDPIDTFELSAYIDLISVACGFVSPSFEAVYCYICDSRRVAVARYQMICLVLDSNVCLSGSHTFLIVTHSYVSQVTHALSLSSSS